MDNQPLKRNNTRKDFIIVGQGIAGSVLAIQLLQAGYSVLVIDQPHLSLSSKVAAGIWNPVVFKRLTKSWLADELVPELISFYQYCQTLFGKQLIYDRAIIKPFTEEQEKILWIKKAQSENLFLDPLTYHNLPIDDHYTVNTYSKVLQAGNLDVVLFLECTRHYLIDHQSYLEEFFDYAKLTHTDSEITYEAHTADRIIFCDGHLISGNPFFNWIPMKPAKGETITIHCPGIQLKNDIFNKGFFILPLQNDLYKIGATYQWEDLNDTPTEQGKEELIKKISAVITSPYKIISHQAGVRPSVIDRRPVVGPHPQFKNMYTFNGLGTKGVMLAPSFAKQLVNFVKNNQLIDEEVSLNRFKKEFVFDKL